LISYHFPPSRAAGALRWQKLARYASSYGWGVDAVALAPDQVQAADQESLADLPPGTRVFGVRETPAPWEPLERAAWKLYRTLRASPRHVPAAGSSSAAVVEVESFARSELPRFPRTGAEWRRAYTVGGLYLRERAWARRAAALGLSLVNAGAHRAVITCGPPHMAHDAGRWIAERAGLPLVMDLRDPWAEVERLHEAIASPLWYYLAMRHERRCVRKASLIVMNTNQARASMVARYRELAERVIAVMNGCDDEPPRRRSDEGPFRVMYAGSVYLDRDPRPLLKAVAAVVRDLRLEPGQLWLEFIGNARAYCGVSISALAEAEGLREFVRQHEHQPRRRLLEMLSDAAMLVSLPQDSHMAIPSKVFEYMSFPAWLLAFATPESATGALLLGTGADVVDPGDVEGAASVLRRRFLEHRAGVRPVPIASQERFTRRHQADVLFGSLARLLEGHPVPSPVVVAPAHLPAVEG
jgi:hypothetical protein